MKIHEPIVLPDGTADLYTRLKTKQSMHFHTCSHLQVSIIHTTNIVHPSVWNIVIIQSSEKYPSLFKWLQSEFYPPKKPKHTHIYYGLSLKHLNHLLEDPNIQQRLQALHIAFPPRFNGCLMSLSDTTITFIPNQTLRCFTRVEDSNVERWTIRFFLRHNEDEKGFPFTLSKKAQQWERDRTQCHSSFPMEVIGNALNPIRPCSIYLKFEPLRAVFASVQEYVNRLISGTTHRFSGSLQSKHVPRYHGGTSYGHCCRATNDLWRMMDPIVAHIVSGLWSVDTCEIGVQRREVLQDLMDQ